MSSWINKKVPVKRYFKPGPEVTNNSSHTSSSSSMVALSNQHIIIDLINKYGFVFSKESYDTITPCAMGIGDILFKLLHIQSAIIKAPLYFNVYYYTITDYYPDPLNMLEFKLQMLKDILDHHDTLCINDVIFYYNSMNYRMYDTQFFYDKLPTFRLNTSIEFNTVNSDEKYIVFHTKCRLSHKTDNYDEVKRELLGFFKSAISNYTIYLVGEQQMPVTYETTIIGTTTIYNELILLKNNNKVIDLTIPNIYNNLSYSKYKEDIALFKNAMYNIHIGLGGQFCTTLVFGNSVIQYCPDDILNNIDISNSNIPKTQYTRFNKIDKFFEFLNHTIFTEYVPSLVSNNDKNIVHSDNYITYISGGKLGDFIFQLGVIHANYIKTGKKGILYISDIGDKFLKGVETAYNDTRDFVKAQDYIHAYHIYNGESYEINLSSWRDIVFTNNINWYELFYKSYHITFGVMPWITHIPIDESLHDIILIAHSIHRENKVVNMNTLLNSYEQTKMRFICFNEKEYISFSSRYNISMPSIICNNLMDLLVSINSCKLFIGNFSAPFTCAIALHKKCIGITPTDHKHELDIRLFRNMTGYWPHVTTISHILSPPPHL